jgi:hypothetical protein
LTPAKRESPVAMVATGTASAWAAALAASAFLTLCTPGAGTTAAASPAGVFRTISLSRTRSS